MATPHYIYADAEQKYVMNALLYGHTDTYVYMDEAHTQKIDKDTLHELLSKGAIIHYESAYYTPVFWKENSGQLEVTIATAIATGASTAVVLKSSEASAMAAASYEGDE